MVQRGRRLCFALESCQGLRIFGDFIRQEFQRDKAMQSGVLGFLNHTPTAAAQLFNDAVVRDGLADHGLAIMERTCAAMLGGPEMLVNRSGGGVWRRQNAPSPHPAR